jgi:hypothetical protein
MRASGSSSVVNGFSSHLQGVLVIPAYRICHLVSIVSLAGLAAADVDFMDIRVGAGVLSDTFKGSSSTTIVDANTNVSTTTYSGRDGRDADAHYRGQMQVVWGSLGSGGGLIIGAGIAANHARFDNGSQDAEVTTPVIDVLLGYGYALTTAWHIELTPFAGGGRAYYSVRDKGNTSTSKDWEAYYEYGAKLGTYITSDSGMQIGVEVPYLIGRFNPTYDHRDANNSYTITDSRRSEGLGLLVTIGKRF